MPDSENQRRVARKEVTINLPVVHAPGWLQGFVDFIREQGVVGVAVGIILGFAAKTLIDSLVNNILNPIVGLLTGGVALDHKAICILHSADGACKTSLGYGQFLSDLISFIILAFVVYMIVKMLKLERLDKKKEEK